MDELEEIKSKINIVDFISEYLTLKKAGRNFKALCPFHTEKIPSFMVSPERQIWHCFGCGEGGDIFTFLMKIEGLDFKEALRILAQRAGVKLKPTAYKSSSKKERIYQMNKLATVFYQKILLETKTGHPVLEYLKGREIHRSTIEEFLLGYAPPKENLLVNLLIKKGFTRTEIITGGLGIVRQGKLIDLFRHRIIFPIRNLHGEVVGFTGRALSEDQMPKYLNTPQTLIFNKSEVLYDLSLAKEEIREKGFVILVEGQMDVLSVYQNGNKNVICSSGTALTERQIDLIKRFASCVVLAFDRDTAGEKAAKRSIDLLIGKGLEVQLIIIPCGKDPDECIRQDSYKWEEAVKKPIPIMDFYFQTAFDKINKAKEELTVRDKKLISQELLPEIKKIPDKIEQAVYVQRLADWLNIEEKVVADALNKLPGVFQSKTKEALTQDLLPPREDLIEEVFLGLTIRYYDKLKSFLLRINLKTDDFVNPETKKIYENFQTFTTFNEKFNLEKFVQILAPQLKEKLDLCLMAVDHYFEHLADKEVVKEALNLAKRIKKDRLAREKKELETVIHKTEKDKNKKKLKELMERFKTIIEEEKKIINL